MFKSHSFFYLLRHFLAVFLPISFSLIGSLIFTFEVLNVSQHSPHHRWWSLTFGVPLISLHKMRIHDKKNVKNHDIFGKVRGCLAIAFGTKKIASFWI